MTDKILIVLPTYNRSNYINNIITQIRNQSYTNWILFIIDDGSSYMHYAQNKKIIQSHLYDSRIIFNCNVVNKNIAATLNKGIDFLLNNKIYDFNYFTWVSDDNTYNSNYLCELIKNNTYFKYASYNIKTNTNTITVNSKYTFDSLLNKFKGCGSYMWTKNAIKQIGYYNTDILYCEDYEFLIRTFKQSNNCIFSENSLMTYNYHKNCCTFLNKKKVEQMNNKVKLIFKYLFFTNDEYELNTNTNCIYIYKSDAVFNIFYYSNQYKTLNFNNNKIKKCFIGNCTTPYIFNTDNVLLVPTYFKTCIYNACHIYNIKIILYNDNYFL
jgi:glycosyltransferase involved in cell wall biosynthesis